MPKIFKTDKEMFEFVSNEGVGLTHSQGYFWFWQKFIPALKKAANSRKVSNELIGSCYYVAGDVHDFNEAPKAAIRCYQQALNFDPEMSAAHREIANMYRRMGDQTRALIHSDKALAMNPEDKFAISDRERFEGDTPPPNNSPFISNNALRQAYEHLATGDATAAMDILKYKKGNNAKRARTSCYGALRETKKYLAAWKQLSTSSGEIYFTYVDWFFMEDDVYMEPDLWRILLNSDAKFSGIFTVFEGLDENERYRALSTHEKIRVRLEYYVYAQSSDFDGLRRLSSLYPEWLELGELLME